MTADDNQTGPADGSSELLTGDPVLSQAAGPKAKAGLMIDPEDQTGTDTFDGKLQQTLKETEDALRDIAGAHADSLQAKSWETARCIVEAFKPVPWFIWRLSNFVLGKPGRIADVSEGMVMGLRRMLFAAASDAVLGKGAKVNNMRQSLQILRPDVIAAVSVIHAICRRLSAREHERVWRPILDDALMRARIGFYAGQHCESFGSGRGMLAGFAGRSGLVVLIATGELEQARRSLELLANGSAIGEVGLEVYRCEPLQVSAMLLSASGCGRDAASGTLAFAAPAALEAATAPEQLCWTAAFAMCEAVRQGQTDSMDQRCWGVLGFKADEDRARIIEEARSMSRRGHGWNWLV